MHTHSLSSPLLSDRHRVISYYLSAVLAVCGMQAPPFFIYQNAEFNQTDVLQCWTRWRLDDQAAEVRMVQLLEIHPSRVYDESLARLFIVPLFPYVSYIAGNCHGSSHTDRMVQAVRTLMRLPSFIRHGGNDHALVTNTFRLAALRALKPILQNFSVGWFENPKAERTAGPNTLYRSTSWRCAVATEPAVYIGYSKRSIEDVHFAHIFTLFEGSRCVADAMSFASYSH